ncbi:molecular chaperone DnaK [Lysinibacillus antri]|uniref:Molecular chaperone DnaK n=1 Tax=Lysinibacillus antri TaxID=2498145 RepID=A0A432LFX0_9BACI|nr:MULTISPECIES: TraR/DksA C4-type zinc finger protein [Lysinibacillus]RUL56566.1 molecular chaperone DnaK [Lysinibacillus antri]TSI07059.1 molecular chaperone DnaK [Lysinibacillus sp. BW-2-10]
MLTENQKSTLKKMLLEQKESLVRDSDYDEKYLERGSLRDSVDELSTVDNHPADLGTELYEREKDMALKVHDEDELAKVNAALEKMDNGTYGVCEVCHEDIPYERLEALPFTAFCIEHTDAKSIPKDRPVEEQVILPPVDNSFSGRDDKDDIHDYEDTFQLVAKYGTSETPSDFEGDSDDYGDLYDDNEEIATNDEFESFHVSEVDQLQGQISKQEIEEARKYDYLE